jgi:putative restriction endonuclease
MAERQFGEIAGVRVGTTFGDRRALSEALVHRPTQAGISGSGAEGADSIVVSGGYEDDIDAGDESIYTGHGGNDSQTGKQIADQTLTRGNLALAKSRVEGLPVRVIRGAHSGSSFAPQEGYRYDGLYYVADHWCEKGRSGYLIWRFKLVRDSSEPRQPVTSPPAGREVPERRPTTTLRIVRNTAVATAVKTLHDHRCQVCGVRLETPAGPYAEGAHIRPLGSPHDGPDTAGNILCLCPNHHALFDLGAFTIGDDLGLIGLEGSLRTTSGHTVDVLHLAYQRDHCMRREDR